MKTLSKEVAIIAKDAVMFERTQLLNSANYNERKPHQQERLEELNQAIGELLAVIYPVVTMEQVWEKYDREKTTFISSTSMTYNDIWHNIARLGKTDKRRYQVTYNENQKTTYSPYKEFYVIKNNKFSTELVPVEFWFNFNL